MGQFGCATWKRCQSGRSSMGHASQQGDEESMPEEYGDSND